MLAKILFQLLSFATKASIQGYLYETDKSFESLSDLRQNEFDSF